MENDVRQGDAFLEVEVRLQQLADFGQVVLLIQQAGQEACSSITRDNCTIAVRLCLFQGIAKDILGFANASIVDQAYAIDTTTE
ncbi:hypothetical protein D9M69_511590 [compost metagenome]